MNLTMPLRQIGFMHGLNSGQVLPQWLDQGKWQHCHPILEPLSFSHQNFALAEVDIFYAQAYPFHQAQAAAIQQMSE